MLEFQVRVLRIFRTPPKSCWTALCGFGSCPDSAGTDRAGVASIKPRRDCACKHLSSSDLTKSMNPRRALWVPRGKVFRGGHLRAATAMVAVRRMAFQPATPSMLALSLQARAESRSTAPKAVRL